VLADRGITSLQSCDYPRLLELVLGGKQLPVTLGGDRDGASVTLMAISSSTA
jgi:hypothetical protein